MAYIASIFVTVRRVGMVGYLEPWRAARPAVGERIYVDGDDLIGAVFELSFPKGPPRRVTAYSEDRD